MRLRAAARIPCVAVLASGVLAGGVLVAAPAATGAARDVVCSYWASPTGDDFGVGSRDRPFRTVGRMVQSLSAGMTGCLEAGAVFEERLVLTGQGAPSRPITITTPSGPRAVIGEGIEFLQSSRDVAITRVTARMSGREPFNALPAVVEIGGFRNRLLRSEVSGGGVVDKSRACIEIDHANLAVVDRNVVHECGIVKENPAIYAPGIRVVTGGGATITNNTIRSTPGDGIALAPNAQGARISNNLIDDTANGIFLAGDARFTSNGNRIVRNIIAYVLGYAAHGSNASGKPVGTRNVVTQNCVWQPGRGLFAGSGFTAPANRVLDPYVNRSSSLAIKRSSPCWSRRPQS